MRVHPLLLRHAWAPQERAQPMLPQTRVLSMPTQVWMQPLQPQMRVLPKLYQVRELPLLLHMLAQHPLPQQGVSQLPSQVTPQSMTAQTVGAVRSPPLALQVQAHKSLLLVRAQT